MPTPITAVPGIGSKTEQKLRKKMDRSVGKKGVVTVGDAKRRKNQAVVEYYLNSNQIQNLKTFNPGQSDKTVERKGLGKARSEQRKDRVREGEAEAQGSFTQTDRFGEALEAFSDEYQGETTFTGPDPTQMREGVEESAAPDEFVSVLPSAVNQRSFLQFPTEDRFEQNVQEQAGRDDAVTPAKEAFVEFVDRDIGLGGGMLTVGEFEVPADEQEEAREAYAERSPEAKQVDSRRRAPITTDADRYERRPGELDFPGIDTPSESPQVKSKDRKTVDADETTLEENTGSLFIRENKTSGGTIGSLKGVFSGGRSPSRGTTEQAEQVAQETVGFGREDPDRSSAVADVTFLEREKDGFGEELIPFGAEESDRNSFEF